MRPPGTFAATADNELGKGDHRHVGEKEERCAFATITRLLDDFERDIENWS